MRFLFRARNRIPTVTRGTTQPNRILPILQLIERLRRPILMHRLNQPMTRYTPLNPHRRGLHERTSRPRSIRYRRHHNQNRDFKNPCHPWLKHKLHLREQRVQRLLRTDDIRLAKISNTWRTVSRRIREYVSEPTPCLQRIRAKRQRKVVNEKRPVRDPKTVIKPDVMPDTILK